MANRAGQKRSGSSSLRYLNSSAYGTVPILRAGAETYIWRPGTSGGEKVWRHVLTRGTSPGSARKRIALKAGVKNTRLATSNGIPHQPFFSPVSPKNWVN